MKKLFSAAELAGILGLARGTIYNKVWRGTLPVVKIHRALRFDLDEVMATFKRLPVGEKGGRK
jgi:excisionase family DNA binding protein